MAHEQIRKLFSEYSYVDIGLGLASKLDSCDHLSEKEKKEYSRVLSQFIQVYITLMDVYGQDIVLHHY